MSTTTNTNSLSPHPSGPSSTVDFDECDISLLHSQSWIEFWTAVSKESGAKLDDHALLDETMFDGAITYFQKAMDVKNETSEDKDLSESVLQKNCFGYLKVFGDITLENTSDGIKDFSSLDKTSFSSDEIAGRFRKLTFVRNVDRSLRPDITIRKYVKGDVDIDIIREDLRKLESNRITPWTTVGFIELKKPTESIRKFIGQAARYCENLLRISPERKVAFCALTNLSELIFTAAYVSPNARSIILLRSGTVQVELAVALAQYVSTRPHYLGFVDSVFRLLESFKPQSALGRGSSSAAVQIVPRGEYQILKVSADPDALRVEFELTNRIRQKGFEEIQEEESEERKKEMKKVLSVIPKCHWGKSWWSLQNILFTPLSGEVTESELRLVWEVLKLAHRAGVVHRDIRRPNIGRINGVIGLMDWSSARCFTTVEDILPTRPGGRSTASIRVLKQMDFIRNEGNYTCTPNDEVISLMYLALQALPILKDDAGIHHHPPSWEKAKINWERALLHLDKHLTTQDQNTIMENIRILSDFDDLDEITREVILFNSLRIIFSYNQADVNKKSNG